MDSLKELISQAIPFAAAVPSDKEWSMPRIVEAVLIAILTGAGAWLLIIPEIKAQLSYVADDVKEIKGEMHDIQAKMSDMQVQIVKDRFTASDFNEYNEKHTEKHEAELRERLSGN